MQMPRNIGPMLAARAEEVTVSYDVIPRALEPRPAADLGQLWQSGIVGTTSAVPAVNNEFPRIER